MGKYNGFHGNRGLVFINYEKLELRVEFKKQNKKIGIKKTFRDVIGDFLRAENAKIEIELDKNFSHPKNETV